MMRPTAFVLLTVLVMANLTGWAGAQQPPPAATQNAASPIAEANNAFALDLYAKLAKQKGNLFFCPSSIHAALTMTLAGAAPPRPTRWPSAGP